MTEPDEFDDPRGANAIYGMIGAVGQKVRARGPLLTAVAVTVLLLIFGGVVWATYPGGGTASDPDAVPVIRADTTPYRARPDDPGGMAIPYRDSTVFDALHADTTAPVKTTPAAIAATTAANGEKIENLLPQPEQPLPRTQLFPPAKMNITKIPPPAGTPAVAVAPPVTSATPSPASQITPQDVATDPVRKPVVAPVTATPVETKPAAVAVAPAVTALAKPAVAPVVGASTEASAAKPVKPSAATSGYYVQLGSVHSQSEAQASWKKAQGTYHQLSPLSLHIEKADLGSRGIYYRVQGGPVDQAQAKSICAAITAQKSGGCLVAKH